MDVLIPIITLSILGLLFGLGLAYASFRLAVREDPRLKKIVDALPGTNCGACGFPGCHAMAERMLNKEVAVDACPVGGASSAEKIAAILGVQLEKKTKKLAIIHCGADCSIRTRRADYDGVRTCLAANLIIKGEYACTYSPLLDSVFDALGMGAGFTLALTIIAAIREIFGSGELFGLTISRTYEPAMVFVLAPGALLTIGLLIGFCNYKFKRRH